MPVEQGEARAARRTSPAPSPAGRPPLPWSVAGLSEHESEVVRRFFVAASTPAFPATPLQRRMQTILR